MNLWTEISRLYQLKLTSLQPQVCGWTHLGTNYSMRHGFDLGLTMKLSNMEPDGYFIRCRRLAHGQITQVPINIIEQLSSEISRLADLGLVEFLPAGMDVHEFISHVNPFGAVAKGDPNHPKVRMVVDPTVTGVKAHMAPLPLSLPSPRDALAMTKSTSVLGKRDLKSGFHHVVLQPGARRCMGFEHPGNPGLFGRWVALPFGAAQSPAIFCNVHCTGSNPELRQGSWEARTSTPSGVLRSHDRC